MLSNKLAQLKQDLIEVKGKLDDTAIDTVDVGDNVEIFIVGYKDLKEAIETLDEHLSEHIEDVEIFIGRTS